MCFLSNIFRGARATFHCFILFLTNFIPIGSGCSRFQQCGYHWKHRVVQSITQRVKSLSRVRLFATQWTVAHQALPSLGFPRQEYWSGVPLPSPMCESEVAQSYPTPTDPVDCSPPGSCIHGILQARVLERGATAFSRSITQKPHPQI